MIRPSGLRDRNELSVLCESEGDCTSEMGAGQFSIFGAYEEKSGPGFHGFTRMKQWLRNERLVRQMIVVLIQAEWCR
jgi:hypothetical protein